jgi:hypothetical protein
MMKNFTRTTIQSLVVFLSTLAGCKDNSSTIIKAKAVTNSDASSENALPSTDKEAEFANSDSKEETAQTDTSKSEDQKNEPQLNADVLAQVGNLLGSWTTSCNTAPESMPGLYIKSSISVSGISLVTTSIAFSTVDCKETSKVEQVVTTNGLGLSGIDGTLVKVDFKITKQEKTAYTEEALSRLKATNPSATLATSTPMMTTSSTIFDLAGIQAGKLCFGDKTGEKTGATSELRPTVLSSIQDCYSKQ